MATVQRFEDLKVWQAARSVSKDIYCLTKHGSFSKDFELKNQINGASGSVMDNIAEGFGRGSRAEFKQFLGFALGSNDEVKSQLHRAYDREHISAEQFDDLYERTNLITKMLVTFTQYLKTTMYRGFKNDGRYVVEEPQTTNYEQQTI